MVEKLAPGLLMEEVCQGVHHSVCHLFACAARATALCSARGAKSGLEHVEKHASVGVVNTMEVLQHSRASGPRFLVRTSAELLPDLIQTHHGGHHHHHHHHNGVGCGAGDGLCCSDDSSWRCCGNLC